MDQKYRDHRDQELVTRILQAAEAVFAERGPEKATLREITSKADVNIAAVSYYFGSKAVLTRAVFDDLSHRLNEIRSEELKGCLAEAENAGKRPDLASVLGIFVRPYTETGKMGRLFARFIMQHRIAPSELTSAIIKNHFDPMAKRFIEAIALACPEVDAKEFYWRYAFMIGAVIYSAADPSVPERAAALSAGQLDPHDTSEFQRAMMSFLVGGMSAPTAPSTGTSRTPRSKTR